MITTRYQLNKDESLEVAQKIGYYGWTQCHFETEEKATKFLKWIHSQEKDIKDIEFAYVAQEKSSFVVRLKSEQAQALSKYSIAPLSKSTQDDLFKAVCFKDAEKFRELFSALSPSQQEESCGIKDASGDTLLRFIAKESKVPLISALPMELVMKHLGDENAVKDNILSEIFFYQPKEVVFPLLENISKFHDEKKIKELLCKQNSTKNSSLNYAAFRQSGEVFNKILDITSKEIIEEGILQTGVPNTTFHIIAQHQPAENFVKLLDLVSDSQPTIDQALLKPNAHKETVLHMTARQKSSLGLIKLLKSASQKAIDQAVVQISKDNESPLHIAAKNIQSSDGFIKLVNTASPEAISQVLVLQNDMRQNALHLAARQPDSAYIELLKKAYPEAIGEALVRSKYYETNTTLHAAASSQTSLGFKKLIEVAPEKAISAALIFKNADNQTPLHVAAEHQSSDGFIELVKKASQKSIDAALLILDNKYPPESPLTLAATFQSGQAFMCLIEKASKEALSKACQTMQALKAIIERQPPEAIVAVLSKVDDDALHYFGIDPHCRHFVGRIAELLVHHPSWDAPLAEKLFKCFRPRELAQAIKKLWLEGHEVPPHVLQLAKSHLSLADSELFMVWNKPAATHKKAVPTSMRGTPLPSDEKSLLKTIWQEGISLNTQHEILSNKPSAAVRCTIETLRSMKRDECGTLSPFNLMEEVLQKTNLQICDELLKQIAENKVVIKIIKEKAPGGTKPWEDFVKQLEDYSYRPELRDKVDKSDQTLYSHKYDFRKKQVITYKHADYKKTPKTVVKKGKIYNQTVYQSATLLSKDANTTVFGERHHDDRLLVGLLFNRDLCDFKAMLKYDGGTFYREWVGTKEAVERYAKRMERISFTDEKEFQQYVNSQPEYLNETLTAFKREAVKAIVIRLDTPEARTIARKRQQDLEKINIRVPIVFYDRETHLMRPYNWAMQPENKGLSFSERVAAEAYKDNLFDAIRENKADQFKQIFSKLSPSQKEESYKIQDGLGTSVAKYVVKVSREFISELPTELAVKELSDEIKNDSNILSDVLYHQPKAVVLPLLENIAKSKDIKINEILSKKDYLGSCALNHLASKHSGEVFIKLLDMARKDVIEASLKLQDSNKETTLHIAARHQPNEGFGQLLKSVNPAIIEEALLRPNQYNDNALHIAAKYQSASGFINLVEFGKKVINEAIIKQNADAETVLHVVAKSPAPDGFIKLLSIASSEAIDDALVTQNFKNDTPLRLSIIHQSPTAFMHLLEKASKNALSKACEAQPTIFQDILENLPPDEIAALFDKINDAAFKRICESHPSSQFVSRIADLLIHHPSWNALLPERLFKFYHPELLAQAIKKLWLEGHRVPMPILELARVYLPSADKNVKNAWSESLEKHQRTPRETPLRLDSKDLLEKIWHKGLSLKDQHALLNSNPPASVRCVIDTLRHLKRDESGTFASFDLMNKVLQKTNLKLCDELPSQISQNKIVLNAMEENRWTDFVRRLDDDSYQPELHATLLSKDANTKVFDETRHGRWWGEPGVGLLFDRDLCEFKAMLKQDGSTNFKDEKTFQEYVNNHPQHKNRVLTAFKREAVKAIVIHVNTPYARTEAKKRQEDLEKLKIHVPIVFYDREVRLMRPYTWAMQQEDLVGVDFSKKVNDDHHKNYTAALIKKAQKNTTDALCQSLEMLFTGSVTSPELKDCKHGAQPNSNADYNRTPDLARVRHFMQKAQNYLVFRSSERKSWWRFFGYSESGYQLRAEIITKLEELEKQMIANAADHLKLKEKVKAMTDYVDKSMARLNRGFTNRFETILLGLKDELRAVQISSEAHPSPKVSSL